MKKQETRQALAYLRAGSPFGAPSAEVLVRRAADAIDPSSDATIRGDGPAAVATHEAILRLLDAYYELGVLHGIRKERMASKNRTAKAAKRKKS